jgi:hypothetical protein
MMAGVLAGFVAHGVFGLTDAVALGAKPGLFFWLLLALTAAVWRVSTASPHSDWNPVVAKTLNADIINEDHTLRVNG